MNFHHFRRGLLVPGTTPRGNRANRDKSSGASRGSFHFLDDEVRQGGLLFADASHEDHHAWPHRYSTELWAAVQQQAPNADALAGDPATRACTGASFD